MPKVVPSQVVGVIEGLFPQMKVNSNVSITLDRGHRNECASIAKLISEIPPSLLNPPNPIDYLKLISNIEILEFTLQMWKTLPHFSGDILSGEHNAANPISIIHDVLTKCPDETILESTTDLGFIDDTAFRNNLRLDISSANIASLNGEWKASTVLSGSVIEALLLWAIKKESESDKTIYNNAVKSLAISGKPDRWRLEQYNKVAKEMFIIKEDTYNQIDLARSFRDLIHPGREIREQAKCSKATAYASIAAVELVIENLSEKFKI